jgi:hypothetical protein
VDERDDDGLVERELTIRHLRSIWAPLRDLVTAGKHENRAGTERVAVLARLTPGSRERALQLIAEGPPFGLSLAGFQRHSVFLTQDAVIFVFEGRSVEQLVRNVINDPARSSSFSRWAPLLEATPTVAREEFFWES